MPNIYIKFNINNLCHIQIVIISNLNIFTFSQPQQIPNLQVKFLIFSKPTQSQMKLQTFSNPQPSVCAHCAFQKLEFAGYLKHVTY